jgi:hypothetical protein
MGRRAEYWSTIPNILQWPTPDVFSWKVRVLLTLSGHTVTGTASVFCHQTHSFSDKAPGGLLQDTPYVKRCGQSPA